MTRGGIFDTRREWLTMLGVLSAFVLALWLTDILWDRELETVPAIGIGGLAGLLLADLVVRWLGRRWRTAIALASLWVAAMGLYLAAPYDWLYTGNEAFLLDAGKTSFHWFALGTTYGIVGGIASLVSRFVWGGRTAEEIRQSHRVSFRNFLILAGVLVLLFVLAFGLYGLLEYVVIPLIGYFS